MFVDTNDSKQGRPSQGRWLPPLVKIIEWHTREHRQVQQAVFDAVGYGYTIILIFVNDIKGVEKPKMEQPPAVKI